MSRFPQSFRRQTTTPRTGRNVTLGGHYTAEEAAAIRRAVGSGKYNSISDAIRQLDEQSLRALITATR